MKSEQTSVGGRADGTSGEVPSSSTVRPSSTIHNVQSGCSGGNTENIIKLLVSTDNHLGFAERDPRRGDDSFTTFEEVLRAARVEHEVDAMLLGGDLFHENKPSLGCLARTSSLFRKYVLGDKSVELSLLSDPAKNFPTHALPIANFQDPNVNIALPVFMIHGNHDDPVGGTSAIDVLATNGYVNYFGHVPSVEEIVVEPVLLRKGTTFLALYGLGNIRDERLHRCFRLNKVHFVHPTPVEGRRWFNILLLHQNRGVRSMNSKGGIFEDMLAGFGMDLVIWGNEHEQRMVPEPFHSFDVVQPGSTVLTSLSAAECNPKQYGIIEIHGTAYRMTPYTLRSVRPTVRRTVVLSRDHPTGRTLDAVEDFLRSVVEEMIEEAEEQISHIPDEVLSFHPDIKFPLMRLNVDFSDPHSTPFPQPNLNRFGQQYMDVVANPSELLRPIRPKPLTYSHVGGGPRRAGEQHSYGDFVVPVAPQLNTLDIRTKVADVFNGNAKDACTLLSEAEVSAAVYAFAEKGERDAIDERIMELLTLTQKTVWRKMNNGVDDSILMPDSITEKVMEHKYDMNAKYARSMEAQPSAGEEVTEAVADEEQQQEEQQHLLRMFDDVSAPTASSDVARPPSTLVEAVKTEPLRRAQWSDEGMEDLPEDGLHTATMDHIVANARAQQANVVVNVAPAPTKRARASTIVNPDDEGDDDVIVVDDVDHRPPVAKLEPVKLESARAAPARRRTATGGRGRGGRTTAKQPTSENFPSLQFVGDQPASSSKPSVNALLTKWGGSQPQ